MNRKQSIIQEIEKIYSYRKIVTIFFIEVILFQILAWNTAGNLYWILGDYLWYSFIFLGLIEAISIAKRNAKLYWESTYLSRLEINRSDLLRGIELDLKIFDVEVRDYFIVKDIKINSDEFKSRLEEMRRHYLNSVLRIKDIFNSLNDNIDELWNQEIYTNLKKLNALQDDDISIIAQSKKSLESRMGNFNQSLTEYRDIIGSKERTKFEEMKMKILPFLMSLIIAIQLGNITNRLLQSFTI